MFKALFLVSLVYSALGFKGPDHPFITLNNSRIVGGETVDIKDAPYAVALHRIDDGQAFFICGGSVVKPDAILTAGHCVWKYSDPKRYYIRAGSTQYQTGGVKVDCKEIRMHPKYNMSKGFQFDIAVLKLAEKLTLSDSIKLINLKEANAEIPDKTVLSVKGWGLTDTGDVADKLQQLSVFKWNDQKCKESFKIDLEGILCAGTNETGKSACRGDSGGPLVEGGVQVGVVNFGAPTCDTTKRPTGYAKVSYFRKWIDSQLVS